ncbi:MAG: MFS transporter, partial [Alphaproteobacteria bacterium]|nr:MFS transporter [Alphaproteobacteria bacterium]
MLQLGFHLTPMQSGAITFSTALGSLSSKLLLNYITDRISFYNIAVYGSAMSAIITVSYGLFVPSTPCWLMLLILAIGGLLQSLFFSCINAVGFSQIEKSQMSQATPIHTVAQQASLALGVAIAGMILEFCIAFHGNSVQIKDFHLAFFVVGFISLFSIAIFKRFDRNVGNELKKTKKIR